MITLACALYRFQLVGLVALVIGVWIISIKRQFEAINSLLTGPAVMTILVALAMVLTAAIGIVGGAKDKLQLLRSVREIFNHVIFM